MPKGKWRSGRFSFQAREEIQLNSPLVHRSLALFLSLSLGLPGSALALRNQQQEDPSQLSGLEEALKNPQKALHQLAQIIAPTPSRGTGAEELQNPEVIHDALLSLKNDPQLREVFTRILDRMLDTTVLELHYGFGESPQSFLFREALVSRAELVQKVVAFLVAHADEEPKEIVDNFWTAFDFNGKTMGPQALLEHAAPYVERQESLATLPILWDLLPSQGVVADVGAGRARLGEAILRHSDKTGIQIHQVFSTDKIDWLGQAKTELDPRHRFILQKGQDVKLAPNSTNLAILKWVLHHMPDDDQQELIRNLFAAVSPGGYVAVFEGLMGERSELEPPFNRAMLDPEIWPTGPWTPADHKLVLDYLDLAPEQQKHVLTLEDFYGHILVSHRLGMPLPARYMTREALVAKFEAVGFQEVPEKHLVYGSAPIVRLGPPSARYVFQKPSQSISTHAGTEAGMEESKAKKLAKGAALVTAGILLGVAGKTGYDALTQKADPVGPPAQVVPAEQIAPKPIPPQKPAPVPTGQVVWMLGPHGRPGDFDGLVKRLKNTKGQAVLLMEAGVPALEMLRRSRPDVARQLTMKGLNELVQLLSEKGEPDFAKNPLGGTLKEVLAEHHKFARRIFETLRADPSRAMPLFRPLMEELAKREEVKLEVERAPIRSFLDQLRADLSLEEAVQTLFKDRDASSRSLVEHFRFTELSGEQRDQSLGKEQLPIILRNNAGSTVVVALGLNHLQGGSFAEVYRELGFKEEVVRAAELPNYLKVRGPHRSALLKGEKISLAEAGPLRREVSLYFHHQGLTTLIPGPAIEVDRQVTEMLGILKEDDIQTLFRELAIPIRRKILEKAASESYSRWLRVMGLYTMAWLNSRLTPAMRARLPEEYQDLTLREVDRILRGLDGGERGMRQRVPMEQRLLVAISDSQPLLSSSPWIDLLLAQPFDDPSQNLSIARLQESSVEGGLVDHVPSTAGMEELASQVQPVPYDFQEVPDFIRALQTERLIEIDGYTYLQQGRFGGNVPGEIIRAGSGDSKGVQPGEKRFAVLLDAVPDGKALEIAQLFDQIGVPPRAVPQGVQVVSAAPKDKAWGDFQAVEEARGKVFRDITDLDAFLVDATQVTVEGISEWVRSSVKPTIVRVSPATLETLLAERPDGEDVESILRAAHRKRGTVFDVEEVAVVNYQGYRVAIMRAA